MASFSSLLPTPSFSTWLMGNCLNQEPTDYAQTKGGQVHSALVFLFLNGYQYLQSILNFPLSPRGLKYLLCGPFWKKFAGLCYKPRTDCCPASPHPPQAKFQCRPERPPAQISKSETQISGPHLLKILDQWAWRGAWNLHFNNHLLHAPQMLLV